MMRIKTKTTTFHSAINYGAILQTIALQRVLENNNIENQVIDYTPQCFNFYNPFYLKKLTFKEKIKKIVKNVIYFNKIFPKYFIFKRFIKNNIKMTKRISNFNDVPSNIDKDDILITGSDQVWSTDVTKQLLDFYTLNFTNNKKISYAASIGSSKILEKFRNDYKNKINNIDCISVREIVGKNELIKSGINKDIEITLDPTLLLTQAEWTNIIYKQKIIKEKYILAYTMENNKDYIELVNKISKETGLKVVYLDYRNIGFKNVLKNCYNSDPFQFISLIRDAEYVITTSFHGTVFSIIFNKNFWVCPHSMTGNRVTNLLDKLDLEDRIVKKMDDIAEKKYDKIIDYNVVMKKLDDLREKSISWLINSIKSK